MQIHSTAIVHPKAELGPDVEIGPYCVIGEHVRIGRGTRLVSHVVVDGWTEIGERCQVWPFSSIGTPPQHLHYKGEPTRVVIGHDNVLREYVTVNRATVEGGGLTKLGDMNFLMAYSHIAHDCLLGSHIIMANSANLAGHITIGDHAVIGGLAGIHQFVRIGPYAMVGGCSAVAQDVPPFMRANGDRAQLFGLNSVGLRRHGFATQRISTLKKVYAALFRSGQRLSEAVKQTKAQFPDNPDVAQLAAFIDASKRGLCRAAGKDEDGQD
ncbi:MAG: acyl-ACP--UDP-N-acetylglucosamine O-acyltransferase [Nitrospiraceae bacterium]